MDIVSVVTQVVKDQQRVIASQKDEIASQRNLIERLGERLEALETNWSVIHRAGLHYTRKSEPTSNRISHLKQ